MLENLSDGVYFVDQQRRIMYWNQAAERITGFSATEVTGRRCLDNLLKHRDETGALLCATRCPLLATMKDGHQREAHIYLQRKSGERRPVLVKASPLYDSTGKIIGSVETFSDNSALVNSRRRASDLERASMLDPLTNVGNRRMGETVVANSVEEYRRSRREFGVLFIDVDLFKTVNDKFGHEVGDEALRIIASTLAHAARQDDEVVRWGGEEFLVVLPDANQSTVRTVAERLRSLVKQTLIPAGDQLVSLTISIGATTIRPGDTPELLLRRADALMYSSKSAGRDRVSLDFDDQKTKDVGSTPTAS